MQNRLRAWLWVPTAYFAEGGPYMAVSTVSAILLKSLGMENRYVALWTGLMMLPWSIKPLWAPFVDLFRSKREWILATQLVMALLFAGIAALIVREELTAVLIGLFFLLAFASATHDVAVDGFYLIALDKHSQALLSGVRGTFYRLASISVQGGLVMLAGYVESLHGNLRVGWAYALGVFAVLMAVLLLWHFAVLPRSEEDGAAVRDGDGVSGNFIESFRSFFRMDGVWQFLLFLLLVRLAEAQLGKIAPLFLQSSPDKGGLGLGLWEMGRLHGTVGAVSLVFGGILGGVAVATFGFGKTVWPLICALNLTNLMYVYLAIFRPASQWIVGGCIAVEQFGYGLGYTVVLLVMVSLSERSGKFKTSHFAIMTGVSMLGMMAAGSVSGWIQERLGYVEFFWYVMICTIPSFLVTIPAARLVPSDFGRKQTR